MQCPICYSVAPAGATQCPTCGTRLAAGELPPELAREDAERRRYVQKDRAVRRETHVLKTTLIGAIVFGVLGTSLSGVRLFNSVRRDLAHLAGSSDERAHAESLKAGFFLAIPLSAVLGAAVGYVIGRREMRLAGGAFAGAVAFAFGSVLLSSPVIATSSSPGWELFVTAAVGLPAGAMLGGLLGYHATSDTE